VNALHHQSVHRLGEGLKIAAEDEIGIIQAIESQESHFLLGVQWHPELLFWKAQQQRLFGALADAARESAAELTLGRNSWITAHDGLDGEKAG
jgi:putative glutamine amidotransferase